MPSSTKVAMPRADAAKVMPATGLKPHGQSPTCPVWDSLGPASQPLGSTAWPDPGSRDHVPRTQQSTAPPSRRVKRARNAKAHGGQVHLEWQALYPLLEGPMKLMRLMRPMHPMSLIRLKLESVNTLKLQRWDRCRRKILDISTSISALTLSCCHQAPCFVL